MGDSSHTNEQPTYGLAQSSSGALESTAGCEETAPGELTDPTASERRQQKNRLAQRRFRDRQRGRSQTLENLLALTTAELQEVKSKQEHYEARNMLLEGLVGAVAANKLALPGPVGQAPIKAAEAQALHAFCKARGYEVAPDSVVNVLASGPAMTITVWAGASQPMTLEDVGNLQQPEFAKLYSEYARQIGACLLNLPSSASSDSQAQAGAATQARMEELAREFTSLMICTALSNPEQLKWCHASKMDGSDKKDTHPPSFWEELLPVLKLSADQVTDLITIRRYFYCKLGQLARFRRDILTKMTWSQVDSSHCSDKLSSLSTWAEDLSKNGAEEYRTYMQWARALFRGVYTSRQHAIGIVYAYPLSNRSFEVCEALAATQGEPSVQQLLEDTSVSDVQHGANWESVINYNHGLKQETVPIYVQFTGRLAKSADMLLSPSSLSHDGGLIPAGKHSISASVASHSSCATASLAEPPGSLQHTTATIRGESAG